MLRGRTPNTCTAAGAHKQAAARGSEQALVIYFVHVYNTNKQAADTGGPSGVRMPRRVPFTQGHGHRHRHGQRMRRGRKKADQTKQTRTDTKKKLQRGHPHPLPTLRSVSTAVVNKVVKLSRCSLWYFFKSHGGKPFETATEKMRSNQPPTKTAVTASTRRVPFRGAPSILRIRSAISLRHVSACTHPSATGSGRALSSRGGHTAVF